MICELTGMEVPNASINDASTAVPEAVMMAMRVTGRTGVVVARSVHPEYREVLATYARHQKMPVANVPYREDGRVDADMVERALNDQTACVVIQSPNFFGTLEDIELLAGAAHRHGALLIVAMTEAASLGIERPPAQAASLAREAPSVGS